ncbi:MAG: polysaccharide biosynthesis/export family protein, partial [Phycisphaerae bacterium]
GYFQEGATYEIRTSLGLEDVPSGIPGAVFPNRSDLTFEAVEYPLQGGDQLDIEIYELRERFIPFRMSARVSPTGFVNIPVVGRVDVAGREVAEFEEHLKEILRDRDILKQPQVTIIPTFLQQATYSVFGIGVSAANNAPLRAGTFPILRPDLKILDAINQVGGLNEFVTDVFVFRTDKPDESAQPPAPVDSSQTAPRTPEPMTETDDDGSMESDRPNTPEDLDRAALLDVVDRDDPVDETTAPAQDLPDDLLEPESSDPWIYVDGEFVRNDKYKGPGEDYSRQALVLDAVTPTVNWSKIAGEANYRILRIPAEQLRDGNPEANIYVRAGDVIRVVSGEIGVYYVMGQVNRVGQFAFNSEPVTLKAAIAAAGGLAPLAWPDRCTIYRRLGQREQMIQVNLDRIFAGKEPDFFIRRADIINVGTHPFAPFLQRIRAASLPTITNVLGYGFTYSRNFADIDAFFPQNNPANRPDPIPQLFQ